MKKVTSTIVQHGGWTREHARRYWDKEGHHERVVCIPYWMIL